MVKTNLEGGLIHESKYFKYVLGARTMAEIEILIFDEKHYGSQARIAGGEKGVSSGRTFETIKEALEDVVALVENDITDFHHTNFLYVVSCKEYAKRMLTEENENEGIGFDG